MDHSAKYVVDRVDPEDGVDAARLELRVVARHPPQRDVRGIPRLRAQVEVLEFFRGDVERQDLPLGPDGIGDLGRAVALASPDVGHALARLEREGLHDLRRFLDVHPTGGQ